MAQQAQKPKPTTSPAKPPDLARYKLQVAISSEDQERLNNRFLGAAKRGDNAAIERLLEAGADINARGPDNWSALHFAVLNQHDDTCKLLIEKGADVNAKNDNNNTVLMYAAVLGNTKICVLLIEKGADVGAKNVEGRAASEMAEINNKGETTAFLRYMETMQASMGRDSFNVFMNSFGECLAA